MDRLKIIVVSGLPGTGKSTVAESVAQKLHLPVFSVDPIESAILQSGIKKSFETGLAAYKVTQILASEQLKLGLSVIIDAVSPINEARGMWHELEKKYTAQLIIVECIVNENEHKKRIHNRVRKIPGIAEITWEDVEKRKKEYIPWQKDRLILDTSQSEKKNLEDVLQYINTEEL